MVKGDLGSKMGSPYKYNPKIGGFKEHCARCGIYHKKLRYTTHPRSILKVSMRVCPTCRRNILVGN